MAHHMDFVEEVNLAEVAIGDSMQFLSTVGNDVRILGLLILARSATHHYALSRAMSLSNVGEMTIDRDLTKRYFRLPRQGFLRPGEIVLDNVGGPIGIHHELHELPDDVWTPISIGCVVLEFLHGDGEPI